MSTKIEWTQETWNPIGGCRKISPGCRNCYAIRQAHRMAGNPNPKIAARYAGLTQVEGGKPNWTGATSLDEDVLMAPLRRRKPTTYFISLSDLFHNERYGGDIDRVFAVMALAHWHTFQVLSKYTARMEEYFIEEPQERIHAETMFLLEELVDCNERRSDDLRATAPDLFDNGWPLSNLWLGVSVENQEQLRRVDVLRRAPAALRFLSLEPMLEDLGDISQLLRPSPYQRIPGGYRGDRPELMVGVDWVIVGGESGPGARPCHIEWIRSIVKQCAEAGVPCFVKQLGAYLVGDPEEFPSAWHDTGDGHRHFRLDDPKGGDPIEWPADLCVRQYPEARR